MVFPHLSPQRLFFFLLGLSLALTLLAFGHSLRQGFSPIDDSFLIYENLTVRGPTVENLQRAFTSFDPELYIPLTFLSYQIDYAIAGLQPWMFHLTNLVLHALNATLVGLLLFQLSGKRAIALFCALLFAIHPLHTEAVAWIAGRKDLLSTFFVLLSLCGYLSYRQKTFNAEAEGSVRHGGGGAGGVGLPDGEFSLLLSFFGRKRKKERKEEILSHECPRTAGVTNPGYGSGRIGTFAYYILSLLFFLFSLLAKVMTVTLPVLLILYDVLIERRSWKKSMIDKIPFFALSGIFLVVASFGKERVLASNTLWQTALMAAKSTIFYIQKLLLPWNLTVYYPFRGTITVTDPQFFVPLLIVIAVLGFLGWRLSKGKNHPSAFGFLFFLVTLAPTFFNFHKGDWMFFAVDRYAYLPSIGILFLAALLIEWLLYKTPVGDLPLNAKSIISAGLLGILMMISIHQTTIWDSPERLFSHALTLYPESIPARTDLANVYRAQGKYEQAFNILKEGLKFGDDLQLRMGAGYIYAKTGDVAGAREQFEKAAAMDPHNPDPLYALGSLLEQTGDTDSAIEQYKKAVDLDDSFVAARTKLGNIYLSRGELALAEEQLVRALQWNPSYFETLVGLAKVRMAQGRNEEARELIEKARELEPGNPEIRVVPDESQ